MKKIFQIILLCVMGITLASCEHMIGEPSLKNTIKEGVAEQDFSKAHSALKEYGEKVDNNFVMSYDYEELRDYVYSEELKYAVTSDIDHSLARVKLILSDLLPTKSAPVEGSEEWIDEDSGYAKQLNTYNSFCEKAIDMFLAIGKTNDALEIAEMIKPVPYNIGSSDRVKYSYKRHDQAVAKVKRLPDTSDKESLYGTDED